MEINRWLTHFGIQQANRHENGHMTCYLQSRQRGVIEMEKCCKAFHQQHIASAVTQMVSSGMR
nr:MAG TPA_asm: hypothetical protein [Caudoviricetes sp.]